MSGGQTDERRPDVSCTIAVTMFAFYTKDMIWFDLLLIFVLTKYQVSQWFSNHHPRRNESLVDLPQSHSDC